MQFIMINSQGGPLMTLLKLPRRAMLAAGAATALVLSPLMASAQTPSDVLIVGQIAEPKALDPAAVTAVNDFRILMNVYDGLVRYKDGTLEVEPSLAKGLITNKQTARTNRYVRALQFFINGLKSLWNIACLTLRCF